MASSAPQLRVALVQGGRIIEDRTFPARGVVSVGSAPDCTFLIPLADVPRKQPVFEATRHGTTLHVSSAMSGEVSLDGTSRPLSSLGTSVALTSSARGRVVVGDVSLLFQFVTPLPKPPPAPLPKGAKGLLAQVDRSFMLVLGLSLAAHFAGAGWISTQPVPLTEEEALEVQPDRFARITLPTPKKQPETTAPSNDKPGTKDTKQPAVAQRTSPPKKGQATGAEVDRAIRQAGLMGVIGSRGPGASAFGDVLSDSTTNDIAAALKDAGGVRVASVDDATATRRRGADQGETSTVDLPGTEGVKDVKLDERLGPPPKPVVKDEGVDVTGSDIDEQALGRWLSSRKAAVVSCYERELKRQPTLQGRVVIHFAVTERGRVDQVRFDDDTLKSQAVEACISNVMRGWVLPFTPEDAVPVSLPFIFSATR